MDKAHKSMPKADMAMMVNKLMPDMALVDKYLLNLKKTSSSS
jgi:hypothetical protein